MAPKKIDFPEFLYADLPGSDDATPDIYLKSDCEIYAKEQDGLAEGQEQIYGLYKLVGKVVMTKITTINFKPVKK